MFFDLRFFRTGNVMAREHRLRTTETHGSEALAAGSGATVCSARHTVHWKCIASLRILPGFRTTFTSHICTPHVRHVGRTAFGQMVMASVPDIGER